jgi:hypothetical protein
MTTIFRPRFKEINPTSDQEQVILGSNLGDGTLTSPYRTGGYINSALKILHSSKQETYLTWKHSMLMPFVHPIRRMTVSDGVRVYFSTGSHDYFTKLRSAWYPEGKKLFLLSNVEHMNWLGLAVWFMDDGTRGYSHGSEYGFLCTEGFGMDVQPTIRDFLMSQFGLLTTVVSTGHGLTKIRLSASAMRILKRELLPYVIPSMLYKLGF